MELVRWMGRTLVKFVALAVALLGTWIFLANVIQIPRYDQTWVWIWVVTAGLAGLAGGTLMLLSFDGPGRFRVKKWRLLGWSLMLVSVAIPTSLTLMLIPLVMLCLPSVFVSIPPETVTSA